MSTPVVDPRHLVTPDAFSISEKALGLPLATGSRRLVAFAIDGILVALLASLGWKILGVLLAFFFFRIATKSAPKANATAGVAARAAMGVGVGFRYSVGCLGGLILFIVFMFGTGAIESLISGGDMLPDFLEVGTSVAGVVRDANALSNAGTVEGAEETAVQLGVAVIRIDDDATVSDVMETIASNLPEIVASNPDGFLRRVEARIREESPVRQAVVTNLASQPDTMSLASALTAFAESVEDSAADPSDETLTAARARIAQAVAGDTIAAQELVITGLRDDIERQRRQAETARQEAEEAGGIFAWFVDTMDELGLTFGWGALYFATLLTWLKGRTPGKRVMGLRVIRLDGEPISLYIAFERAGGYAAGVATGLLGFAQVLWDPNRQAIHDKIAGTVVIVDGAERLPGANALVPE